MSEMSPEENSSLVAAMFKLVQKALPDLEELPQTEAEIQALTGADLGEAYEMCDKLCQLLATVVEESRHAPPAEKIRYAVEGFADVHADAVRDTGGHRTYSADFRDFVLEMMGPGEPGEGMSCTEMARATGVPQETLQDWIRQQTSLGASSMD